MVKNKTRLDKLDEELTPDINSLRDFESTIHKCLLKHKETELADQYYKKMILGWNVPIDEVVKQCANLRRMHLEREVAGEIIAPVISEAIKHRGAAEFALEELEESKSTIESLRKMVEDLTKENVRLRKELGK